MDNSKRARSEKSRTLPRDRAYVAPADLQHALERIRQAACRDKELRFTSLWHHVYNVDRLWKAYFKLKRKAAAGVDDVTWEQYGEELEDNLQDLSPPKTVSVVARESQNRSTSSVSRTRATALETDVSLCFDRRSENACERNSLRSNVNSEDACTTLFRLWASGYVALYKDTSSTTPCHAISGNSTPSSIRCIVSGSNRCGDGANATG